MSANSPTTEELSPFAKAQHDRAWIAWTIRVNTDMLHFFTSDVPGLVSNPWSRSSIWSAELTAFELFPTPESINSPELAPVADRWNRYALQAVCYAVPTSGIVNQPSDSPGVRPAVLMPWGEYIGPLLEAVLTEPDGPRRGRVVLKTIEEQQARYARWLADGKVEADEYREFRKDRGW